ncbi:ABC transporter permease [Paenibacillus silviterrae]|uniref:ABC transporter permease n=1 Tax=Paenibacillus silviterrae TaxID=3242194 RepID=UPI0025432AB3|nr:ABC transporter permease subunit [Paenibacillus chinjuensis]
MQHIEPASGSANVSAKSSITGGFRRTVAKDFVRNKYIYMMVVPVVIYYIIMHYMPMYGAVIAFKQFNIAKGIWNSPWVGFKHFQEFFESYYFWRVVRNTLLINFYGLIFGFPAPIILALLLNEIRAALFKRVIQTATYLPHFISLIVICGMIIDFVGREGLINDIIVWLGGERSSLLSEAGNFRTIYIASGVWQEIGWGSIIYLAALSGINPELYEASKVDGAGRWRQLFHITIPGITPIILILLILKIGHMMDVGFEKIILLYNPTTFETADVISSYVYRKGLSGSYEYSSSSAIGLFQSLINFSLLITANWLTKRMNGSGLW